MEKGGVRKERLLDNENKVNWSGDYRTHTGVQVCKAHGRLHSNGDADYATGEVAGQSGGHLSGHIQINKHSGKAIGNMVAAQRINLWLVHRL